MARPCTLCSHPKASVINAELLSASPVSTVARKWHLGASSVARHSRGHLRSSILREARVNDEFASSDLVERLVETLSDVSAVRSAALLSGQSGLVLRAAAATESVIRLLMERIGLDDLEVARELADGQQLARAVGRAARANPAVGSAVGRELRVDGGFESAEALENLAAHPVNREANAERDYSL